MIIVFLLEEESMKIVLDTLLPQILPSGVRFLTIPHRGKSELRKSIPNKLKGWMDPEARFVVVHDQDANDCYLLKSELAGICAGSGKEFLVRIACRELEAWYFGDLEAVSKAYDADFTRYRNKSKYRNPDSIVNPKTELKRLIPQLQQLDGARRISKHMDINRNTSKSFRVFVDGVRRICNN